MFRYVIFISLFICLFSFKWSIIQTSGSGLRLDDFIIVFITIFSACYFFTNGNTNIPRISRVLPLFIMYVFLCIISSIYNSYSGRVPFSLSVLYSLRNIEYLAFIFLGFWFFKYRVSPERLFQYYVLYAFVLIILQYLHIVPVVSKISLGRAIANTGGPWELAAISTFFCVYFFKKKKWLIFMLSTAMLLLSESRISLLALLIFIAVQIFKSMAFNSKYTYKSIIFSAFLLSIIMFLLSFKLILSPSHNQEEGNIGVVDRYSSIMDESNQNKILKIIASLPSVDNQQDYIALTYSDAFFKDIFSGGGDASALIRFSRWVILIKSTFSNPDTLLIGLGPSFAGLAVDGNYTRIFAETGLLGLFSFILFSIFLLFRLRKNNEFVLFWYYFCLCVTGLFIDVFVTYKAMMLFWFYYGYRSCVRKYEIIYS